MKKQITLLIALAFSSVYTFGQASSTGSGSSTTMMQNKSNGTSPKNSTIRCESSGTGTNKTVLTSSDGTKTASVTTNANATNTNIVTTATDGTRLANITSSVTPSTANTALSATNGTFMSQQTLNGINGEIQLSSENTSTSFLSNLVMNPTLSKIEVINDNTGSKSTVYQEYDSSSVTLTDIVTGKFNTNVMTPYLSVSALAGSNYLSMGVSQNGVNNNLSIKKLNFQTVSNLDLDTGYVSLTYRKPNDLSTNGAINFVKEGDGIIGVFEVSQNGNNYRYGHSAHNNNISRGAELYEYYPALGIDTKGIFIRDYGIYSSLDYDIVDALNLKKNRWDQDADGFLFRTNIIDVSGVPDLTNSNYYTLTNAGFETKYVDGAHNTFATLSAKSGGIVGIAEDAGAGSLVDFSATDGTNYSSLVMNTGQLNGKVESATDISTHILSPTALTISTQTATTTTTFATDEVQTIQQSYIKTTTATDGSNTTQFDQTATDIVFYEQSSPVLTIGNGARVKIAAGSSAAGTAPLKLTTGTLNTTPENGAIEYNSDNLQFTTASTRYVMAKTLTSTATLDFPSTAAGQTSSLTMTVTGVATGDFVQVDQVSGTSPTTGTFWARATATNTVTVYYVNTDPVNAVNPSSADFRSVMIKY